MSLEVEDPSSQQTQTYEIRTLGCKANLYDSQLLEAQLQSHGWRPVDPGEQAMLCIVNSCTVTNEADKQSRKMAEKMARQNRSATVVMTGCSAEVDPAMMGSQTEGLHFVVANRDKFRLLDLLRSADKPQVGQNAQALGASLGYPELLSQHPQDRDWPLPEKLFISPKDLLKNSSGQTSESSRRTRSFLKIQEGCNSFCTFCIIPYGRGPSRSLRPSQVIQHINEWVDQGTQEVVLTGTNIGEYGSEWFSQGQASSAALDELVALILRETQLSRLRVSSLDPTQISPQLMEMMETNSRFCPHFHVSLQSPHSKVLRMMKRRYGFEEVKNCLEQIAQIKRSVFVGMDVITGFPGESEVDFAWTQDVLADLPWSRLHVFPYSEREGTPATRFKAELSVPVVERRKRSRILNELSLKRLEKVYQERLAERPILEQVLVEGASKAPVGWSGLWLAGYTPDYLRVAFPLAEGQELASIENSVLSLRHHTLLTDSQAGDCLVLANTID